MNHPEEHRKTRHENHNEPRALGELFGNNYNRDDSGDNGTGAIYRKA